MEAPGADNIDPELVAAACREMRRPPPGGNAPHHKKQRTGEPAMELVSRFAYNAPARLQAGARGLLLTCQVRNERTATKEAMSVLQKYLPEALLATGSTSSTTAPAPAPDANAADTSAADTSAAEKEQHSTAAAAGESAAEQPAAADLQPAAAAQNQAAATTADQQAVAGASKEDNQQAVGPFSIVKVGCTGVVLLLLNEQALGPQAATTADTQAVGDGVSQVAVRDPFFLTQAVQRLYEDVDAKKVPACKHCQRICPLEQTCLFEATAMRAQVAQLVEAFKASPMAEAFKQQIAEGTPVKYAASFKNRVTDPRASTWNGDLVHVAHPYGPVQSSQPSSAAAAAATPAAGSAATDTGAPAGSVEGGDKAGGGKTGDVRSSVLKLLAGALAETMGWPLAVDLKAPQLLLLCEVVPAHGQQFAGLSLLPANMCMTKPRLGIKNCGQGKN